MALTVKALAPDELEPFVALPARLHAGEPWFSPPFTASVLREVSGSVVPAAGGAVRPFLVLRDGTPVARAAAILHPALRDGEGRPVGQVGYFEAADADGAGHALGAALDALRGLGARSAVGPMNGGAHRPHRLMTRGFERAPFLFEPRNPAWYADAFVASGFTAIHTWRSFEPDAAAVARMEAEASAAVRADARRFRVDLPDPRDPARLLARVHALLDRVWAGHLGYVPFGMAELVEVFGPLLPLLPPGHVGVVVDARGEDVGFGYMYPDWFEQVRALGGDPGGWGSWMGSARARRVVVHTAAVLPDARGTSAMSHLGLGGLATFREQGYEGYLPALATQDYRYWDGHAPATREYTLYGRPL